MPLPELVPIHEEKLSACCNRALCSEPVLLKLLSPRNFTVGFLFVQWVVCVGTVACGRVANQYYSSRCVLIAVLASRCISGLRNLGAKVGADIFVVGPVPYCKLSPASVRDDGCAYAYSVSFVFFRKWSLLCVVKVSMFKRRSMLYVGLVVLHFLVCKVLDCAGFSGW